jgi:uncharacterized protein with von Willebrand factor type A (vWA) domain
MIQRQLSLSSNMVAFCRYLRGHQFKIGFHEEEDALRALLMLNNYHDPLFFQQALSSTLCKNQREVHAFPTLFRQYWKELEHALESNIDERGTEKQVVQSNHPPPSILAIKQWLYGNKQQDTTETAGYSPFQSIGQRPILAFDEEEVKEIMHMIRVLAEKLANRRIRRYRKTHLRKRISIQATIKENLRKSTDIVRLHHKEKKKKKIRVVMICDVSKSMELYSRFLLQFMFAFQNKYANIQSFAFSTKLHDITQIIKTSSLENIGLAFTEKMSDWSGGTHIGKSIQQFMDTHFRNSVNKRTITMILSDGWDQGEDENLGQNLKFLRKKSLKLIWLNPLAGNSTWKPEVQAMQAALPHLDLLLPFHNLNDVKRLIWEIG